MHFTCRYLLNSFAVSWYSIVSFFALIFCIQITFLNKNFKYFVIVDFIIILGFKLLIRIFIFLILVVFIINNFCIFWLIDIVNEQGRIRYFLLSNIN